MGGWRQRTSSSERRSSSGVRSFLLSALVLASALIPAHPAAAAVGFGKSVLQGESSELVTSLQFGPDGRLYVAQVDGVIKAYRIARTASNDYSVRSAQTIPLIASIANRDDDGRLNPTVTGRLVTGLLVVGTSARPVIYVASSDPRIGGGADNPGLDLDLDTNSGVVSRLSWDGAAWTKVDLVRGLPRSERDHATNGLQLDPVTNTLYLAVGGHTNKGAPSANFAYLTEYALSAAILSIDLDAIGDTTYDLPTLNDDTRAGSPDTNDPFGGNDGKNQARVVTGGPVQIHSPGYRNPYDVLITKSGRMFTIDNDGNAGWGDVPVDEGPHGTCTNQVNEPGVTDSDGLYRVTKGFYGGHANPTRGNRANTFNSNAQSPVPSANPIECDYQKAGAENRALTLFDTSTNGLDEYTASNFSGAMRGDLLAAAHGNIIWRLKLDSNGDSVTLKQQLFTTPHARPLDVTAQGDSDIFPGTVWVGGFASGEILVFEPNDFGGTVPTCTSADDSPLDEDGDGYSNADEIDNGTNPCSAADAPPDWDADLVSNLNDPDDDNDALSDRVDPFAIDPENGTTTTTPVSYSWDAGDPNPGGLLDLGFTGLMTNGTSDYEDLFDPTWMTAGGAAGVTTVDEVPDGTALRSANNQQYGFQFGVKAEPASTDAFTVHTAIAAPFAGITPQDFQSMGLMIGLGDQDNYAKLILIGNGGAGGIRFLKEVGGAVSDVTTGPLTLPGPERVDLYLLVDPDTATVQASYSVTEGGITGPRIDVGGPVAVPTSWFGASRGLAVGLISASSGQAPPFAATWELLEAIPATGRPDAHIKLGSGSTYLGDDVYNTTGQNQTKRASAAVGTKRTFYLRFQNDGAVTDSLTVAGGGSATGFSVRYFAGATGTTEITSAVVAGTYAVNNLASGASRVIRAEITVLSGAENGASIARLITATSRNDQSRRDAVKAVVNAP